MPRDREANAAYMREWRARNGIGRDLDQSRAYRNALIELRERHRDEFEEIYRRWRAELVGMST